jgi:4-oxalmesaconate hydratase
MIIDCHGHYTTAPGALQKYRDEQIAGLKAALDVPMFAGAKIGDDEIRDSLENAQLKLQRARVSDLTIFSPRASAMAHHIGNETTSRRWI